MTKMVSFLSSGIRRYDIFTGKSSIISNTIYDFEKGLCLDGDYQIFSYYNEKENTTDVRDEKSLQLKFSCSGKKLFIYPFCISPHDKHFFEYSTDINFLIKEYLSKHPFFSKSRKVSEFLKRDFLKPNYHFKDSEIDGDFIFHFQDRIHHSRKEDVNLIRKLHSNFINRQIETENEIFLPVMTYKKWKLMKKNVYFISAVFGRGDTGLLPPEELLEIFDISDYLDTTVFHDEFLMDISTNFYNLFVFNKENTEKSLESYFDRIFNVLPASGSGS